MPTPDTTTTAPPGPPPVKERATPYIIIADNDVLAGLYYQLNTLTPPDHSKHDNQIKNIKTDIRVLAREQAMDQQLIYIIVPGADRTLSVSNHPRMEFDEKAFAADNPELYKRYLKEKERWEVRWVKL